MNRFAKFALILAMITALVLTGCSRKSSDNKTVESAAPRQSENNRQEEASDSPVPDSSVNTYHDKVGNTQANLSNLGLVVEKEDCLYYCNFEDGGRIYRREAGSAEATPVNNEGSMYLNLIDSWIYYIGVDWSRFDYMDGGAGIYRIKTDGTERTQLYDGSGITSLAVADGWIYFSGDESGGLYKMKLDGTDKTALIDANELTYITVQNDRVYGNRHEDRLYRFATDGNEDESIRYDRSAVQMYVEDPWIYHFYGNRLYKFSPDTGEELAAELIDGVVISMTVHDGWIYFLAGDENGDTRLSLFQTSMEFQKTGKLMTIESDMDVDSIEGAYLSIGGSDLHYYLYDGETMMTGAVDGFERQTKLDENLAGHPFLRTVEGQGMYESSEAAPAAPAAPAN